LVAVDLQFANSSGSLGGMWSVCYLSGFQGVQFRPVRLCPV